MFTIPIGKDTHIKFRNFKSKVNIEQLKIQYQKAKYRDLIQSHVKKMDLVKLEMAILGPIAAFNSEEKRVAEIIMEEYVQASINKTFWEQDCDVVLSDVITEFKSLLSQHNYESNDEILFKMFNLLTMYFASVAIQNKN